MSTNKQEEQLCRLYPNAMKLLGAIAEDCSQAIKAMIQDSPRSEADPKWAALADRRVFLQVKYRLGTIYASHIHVSSEDLSGER